jgi:hypothetical protein
MAEEQQNQGQGGGRRRYFRRRQRTGKNSETNLRETGAGNTSKSNKARSNEKPVTPEREVRTPTTSRRRRRSRVRSAPSVIPRAETPEESIVDLDDYAPPASVFVYSYILRPDMRDSYEFRAEHFSGVGRKLEDYQLDVSVLFSEEGVARTPVRKIDPALLDDDMNGDDE